MHARMGWQSLIYGLCLLTGCSASEVESVRPQQDPTSSVSKADHSSSIRGERENAIGMRLVYIPGGSFLMGHDFADTRPVHRVSVSGFWMGKYEVTNEQYDLYRKRPRIAASKTDQQPAVGLSWYDATDFCKWLSEKERHQYRLPTEAEWEYAARGGLAKKHYPWGDEAPKGRATIDQFKSTRVGSHAPNAFGLYDMAGNVQEWVLDWYDERYYARSPSKDPRGPSKPKSGLKVVRGGEYGTMLAFTWLRMALPPRMGTPYTGFRVVMVASVNGEDAGL